MGWSTPIRTTGGEAAISGGRGQRPLGSNAEWEKWRWYTEIRTKSHCPEEADQADGCPVTSLVVNSNLGDSQVRIGAKMDMVYANSNRAGVQGRSSWPSFESWRQPSSNR
jgi:hypothetical protein